MPEELLCGICHDLMSDAVVIPCCGNSYCDDCESHTRTHTHAHTYPDWWFRILTFHPSSSLAQVSAVLCWTQRTTSAPPVANWMSLLIR